MPKVIIAEDDLYMADMLEEILVDNNYEVCGIGRTVDEAVALGERHKPDLAILDIRLADGGLGTDIPGRWPKRDRPGILYATAYVGQTQLSKSDGEASLAKPYRPEDVIRALEIVQELVSTGKASRPFPHGLAAAERLNRKRYGVRRSQWRGRGDCATPPTAGGTRGIRYVRSWRR